MDKNVLLAIAEKMKARRSIFAIYACYLAYIRMNCIYAVVV